MMGTVLVIDDHETIRVALSQIVRKMGLESLEAGSGKAGLELMKKNPVDFVITDLKMEGFDGVAVLERISEMDPDVPVMIVTAYGTVETAVSAMKLGAFDFITKPFSPEVVRLKVQRALELSEARRAKSRAEGEAEILRAQVRDGLGELKGSSPQMQEIYRAIEKVASTDATVLISGESGTGKELVARAIHEKSERASGPFIAVNCGALAEGLLESELFGHEKGAFTGAVRRKLGRFELADRGTIFLDEVSEIGPGVQVKLLRVLQQKCFERVGSEQTKQVDVRILSATNRDLEQHVREGGFRQDLFYRLMVVPIHLPPLRDRRSDIPELARHFVAKLRSRLNPAVEGLSDDAVGRLMAYDWPGNVRELENAVEQALVFAEGESISAEALPARIRGPSEATDGGLEVPSEQSSLPEILEDLEKQLILRAYHEADGVKTETARRLGIKTSALYYKLEKYGII
jgi:two-component system response regulator HydG